MRTLDAKVAGVTFENRQEILESLSGREVCRLTPEPTNSYDPNAIAVEVATGGDVVKIGYIPAWLAKEIAPYMEGESFMVEYWEITGGFLKDDGSIATLGARVVVRLPEKSDLT
jgi:single-stranded-DNA-specific exonuclease